MATKEPLSTPVSLDEAYAYHLVKAARVLRWYWQRSMRRLGLETTQEQWILLNRLVEHDGQSPSDLVDSALFDKPNITRMLASMERQGLVERKADPADGRRVRFHLTEHGDSVHRRIVEFIPEGRAQVYRGLNGHDLSELKRILGILEENALSAG